MSKFDWVLSDVELFELAALSNPLLYADSEGDFYLSEDGRNVDYEDVMSLLRKVEQATIAALKVQLADQEPAAWTSAEIMSGPSFVDDDDYAVMYKTKSHLLDDFCGYPEATPVPLYTHPIPVIEQEPAAWQQLVYEVCGQEAAKRYMLPNSIFNCMMKSTGDGNLYPDPLASLAELALSAITTDVQSNARSRT